MSTEVTYIRTEDLLDESEPQHRPSRLSVTKRRQFEGLAIALVALPLLTLFLDGIREDLALDGQVLLYLLAVLMIAIHGGPIVGTVTAIAAALLINYFFVDPLHTLSVADPDQVVALVVFVAVAALVSGAVEFATRRARAAEAARREAAMLSKLAGPDLSGEESLRDILRHARTTFGLESVAFLVRQRGTGAWVDAGHAGWAPGGEEAPLRIDIPAGPNCRLVGRGPELFAEDERVLQAFAAAARTAYEGRILSGEAEQGKTLATVDKQRTALLSAVGHDLRTPLASVKAAVSTLRQTDVEWSSEARSALLETIEESTDRLDGVVSNLLDASRLNAGSLTTKNEPVALDEVVSAAVLDLPDRERVLVDVPEDLPRVSADLGLLQRVFVNLLDNALRHGAEGPVEVRAFAGNESAKVEVSDHGAGVPEAARESLFVPFDRLGRNDSDGLGLGLSVARGFVEAMGGALAADDTPGGGLTMRIRLELANNGSASPGSAAESA